MSERMPRYYFETGDDRELFGDHEGTELPGPRAARLEALAALPDMMRDNRPHGEDRVFTSRVRDANGIVVFEGTLTLKGTWHAQTP